VKPIATSAVDVQGISRYPFVRVNTAYIEAMPANPVTTSHMTAFLVVSAACSTQPILPLRPGLRSDKPTITNANGTTTLFAALNVLYGIVIGECQPRDRNQEFLRFLSRIVQSIDPGLDVHLVLDSYGTHKHPDVKRWLAARPLSRSLHNG
jgi:hypothetical protein